MLTVRDFSDINNEAALRKCMETASLTGESKTDSLEGEGAAI